MSVDWDEVQKAIIPIKDYEDLCQRWRNSFAYPFVGETYNFSMAELANYTQELLGGDPRGRYTGYASMLTGIVMDLDRAGVINIIDLMERVETREKLARLSEHSGIAAPDIASVLKYLIYWVIPMEKLLPSLVRDGHDMGSAFKVLRELEVRTNLGLLQQGISPSVRKELAEASGLPEATILELVNRADFSRMPWASKATISNIIGAGYGSLAELANAEEGQLYKDYFAYGKAIGKNLKLGNEIESSYRIAQILPAVVQNQTGLSDCCG
jgi:hypothetical protein